MKMKLNILFLLGIFLSLTNANTQADSSKIFKTHSMQFRVNNFVSLSSFKGAFISYKYHSSDRNALRVGMSFRIKKWEEEVSLDYFYSDTILFDQNRDNNYMDIEIMIEYLRYFNLKNEVKMFLGAGPRVAFNIDNFDTDDSSVSGNRSYDYIKKGKNDRYQIGLTFTYGLEWFFKKDMSLHAEYGFNVSYIYQEYGRTVVADYPPGDSIRIDDSSRKDSGFEIDDTGALLGLSIYF
jgi:hypothetical protein